MYIQDKLQVDLIRLKPHFVETLLYSADIENVLTGDTKKRAVLTKVSPNATNKMTTYI